MSKPLLIVLRVGTVTLNRVKQDDIIQMSSMLLCFVYNIPANSPTVFFALGDTTNSEEEMGLVTFPRSVHEKRVVRESFPSERRSGTTPRNRVSLAILPASFPLQIAPLSYRC